MARPVALDLVPSGFVAVMRDASERDRARLDYSALIRQSWPARHVDRRARVQARCAVRRLRELRTLEQAAA